MIRRVEADRGGAVVEDRDEPVRPKYQDSLEIDQLKKYWPAAVITIAALLFIVQNTEQVDLEFLWFSFQWPLWIMLLIFAGVGAVVFWAVQRRRAARAKRTTGGRE
jgi:uncharacterized integral membrane protein